MPAGRVTPGRQGRTYLRRLGPIIFACLAWVVTALVPAASAAQRPAPPRLADAPAATAAGADDPSEVSEPPSALPSGGTEVVPEHRVVSLYGAPQLTRTVLGYLTPQRAARRLQAEAARYEEPYRPVVPAFDLIATVANAAPGRDRLYRTRQSDTLIATYLSAARRVGARLILDVQPGRADFLTEAQALEKWLREPDVDLALDPEWNVGRRGVPGRTQGAVRAQMINQVQTYLAGLVAESALPQKLLIVHQFREAMIRDRDLLEQRPEVGLTLSFDGIGTQRQKRVGYESLSSEHLANGMTIFYRLDRGLFRPFQILGLDPVPDYVMYQ